jgi:hypothetical protein
MLRAVAVSMTLVLVQSVRAQDLAHLNTQSGSDLIAACRSAAGDVQSSTTDLQQGVCLGQIEALAWVAPALPSKSLQACLPTDTTKTSMAKVVADYLDQNADRLHEPFEGLALEALAQTWPCPPRPSGWLTKLWHRLFAGD